MQLLKERGVRLLGPASGEQACGEVGVGRMLEPAQIADEIFTTRGGGRCAARLESRRHCRADARSDRSGALHQQSQLRQDGLRGRAGSARSRRRSDAGERTGADSDAARRRAHRSRRVPSRCWKPFDATSVGADIFISAAAVSDYRCAPGRLREDQEDQRHDEPVAGARAGCARNHSARRVAAVPGRLRRGNRTRRAQRARETDGQKSRHDRRQQGRRGARRSTRTTTR